MFTRQFCSKAITYNWVLLIIKQSTLKVFTYILQGSWSLQPVSYSINICVKLVAMKQLSGYILVVDSAAQSR